MRPDRDVLERGPHEGHSGASRSWNLVQHRTAWEPPQVRAVRAVWTYGGWALLFACARFSRSASRASSLLEPERCPTRSRALSTRRRLSTSWMLTLRAPSFHVGAGRAFTSCVPTSDAPCRLPAPACRLLFRPPAPPPCSALERTRFGSTERPESFHRPLAWRSHLPVTRRWRNDSRRLPSYRIFCLPPQVHAAFQLRTLDVSRRRTDSNDMPSL
jgi:hypothetical protein